MIKKNLKMMALCVTLSGTMAFQIAMPSSVKAAEVDPENKETISQDIKNNKEAQVVLLVDNKVVCGLENKAAYEALVKMIEKEFSSQEEGSQLQEMTIEPSLSMKNAGRKLEEIKTVEDAFTLLLEGGSEKALYIAEKEETLASIAKKYNMTIEEIKELNTNWEDPVQEGTQLIVLQKAPLVKVETKEVVTTHEDISFETVTQEDPSIRKGQTKVQVEGKNGQKNIKTHYSKINGQVVSSIVSSVEILQEPTNQVVLEGTMEAAATGSFINPTTGRFTSKFGPRWGRFHYGIDVANSVGTPIIASDGGVVTRAAAAGTYGNLVEIDHQNGYVTRYAHLSQIGVKVGQQVSQGELLGKMGSTGRSTGSHLHFEIRQNGTAINPLNFVKY